MKRIILRAIAALLVVCSGLAGAQIVDQHYVAPYSGAVSRSFADKANEAVDAADFGAAPSATATTNAAAFAAAIATGRAVHIRAGAYDFNAELTPLSGQTIYGDGPNATILRQTLAGKKGIYINGRTWVTVRDLGITNTSGAPTSAGSCITVGSGGYIDLLGLQLYGCYDGLETVSAGTTRAQRINIHGNYNHGIHIRSSGVASVDVQLRDIISTVNNADGLRVTGLNDGHSFDMVELNANIGSGLVMETDGTGSPAHIWLSKLWSDSNKVNGIRIGAGANAITFSQPWVSNRGSGKNFVISGTDIDVIGGTIFNVFGHGIEFNTASGGSVTGTVIQEAGINSANTYDGINISSYNVRVTAPKIYSGARKTRYGVRLESGAHDNAILGGQIVGMVLGKYSDNSGGSGNYFFDGNGSVGVLGVQMLANGTFDANTTGWRGGHATIASTRGAGIDGNAALTVTATDALGSNWAQTQLTGMMANRIYTVTASVKSGTSGNEPFEIRVMNGGQTATLGSARGVSSAKWTTYTLTFKATDTTPHIMLMKQSTTNAATMLFDSVLVH